MDNLVARKKISALLNITSSEFELIRKLIYDRFGISLSHEKKSLVVGRLNKVLRENGFTSFREYYDCVIADNTGKALATLIDRISTNHTFFFRENDHFDFFSKTALPAIKRKLTEQNRRDFRLWCAGSSSGEEPYTLAILLLEFWGREINTWDVRILATDISNRALEKAKAGIYHNENVAKMPEDLKRKYFKRISDTNWVVSDQVKKLVLFRRFNLMRQSFPFKKKFNVIFCRNVMIYFDNQTRETLVQKFGHFTEPGGYLFIGHSETLGRDNLYYKYLQPAVYHKVKTI